MNVRISDDQMAQLTHHFEALQKTVEESISRLEKRMDSVYVSKKEFNPIKKMVGILWKERKIT